MNRFKLSLLAGVWSGAFGVTRLVSALLYDVRPTDPAAFISVSLLLLICGNGGKLASGPPCGARSSHGGAAL